MGPSNNPNCLDLQHPNLIDTKKFGDIAFCLPMANAGTDNDDDIAIRCRVITRLYAGGNSRAFAEDHLKIGYTRWQNIEGSGALSRDVARLITRRYPEVSLDWLYRGIDAALTPARSRELMELFTAISNERRPAAKAKVKPKRRRISS